MVTLMESSMLSAALISADNALHSSFPDDATAEYRHQVEKRNIDKSAQLGKRMNQSGSQYYYETNSKASQRMNE